MDEMTAKARPLCLGDIVTKTDRGRGDRGYLTRGVVVKLGAEGTLGRREAMVAATHGFRGTTTYTDFGVGDGPGDWSYVPENQETWEERVLSASARWKEPHWTKGPLDVDNEMDSYGWALFEVFSMALRPTSEDGGDWPSNWLDLALDFAMRLDGHLDSTGEIGDRRRPRPCLAARKGA